MHPGSCDLPVPHRAKERGILAPEGLETTVCMSLCAGNSRKMFQNWRTWWRISAALMQDENTLLLHITAEALKTFYCFLLFLSRFFQQLLSWPCHVGRWSGGGNVVEGGFKETYGTVKRTSILQQWACWTQQMQQRCGPATAQQLKIKMYDEHKSHSHSGLKGVQQIFEKQFVNTRILLHSNWSRSRLWLNSFCPIYVHISGETKGAEGSFKSRKSAK